MSTAVVELRELLVELVEERRWLERQGWLLPGDGTAADMQAHFAGTIRTAGVEEALRQAKRHYRAATRECRILALADVARTKEATTTPAVPATNAQE